jgi:membrane fusion protein, multidrug efflux system
VLDQSERLVMTVDLRCHREAEDRDQRRPARRLAREAGDRVVIDGLAHAIPGTKVAPQDGTIHYNPNADQG